MDILSTKLLDAGRAHKILSNTHKRFGRLRRKTDEEYLRIIIDEVNLYFSELSSSIMDISKLPDNKDGPSSIAQLLGNGHVNSMASLRTGKRLTHINGMPSTTCFLQG